MNGSDSAGVGVMPTNPDAEAPSVLWGQSCPVRPPNYRSRRIRRVIIIVAVVAVATVVVALYTIPVRMPYGVGFGSGCLLNSSPACPELSFPLNGSVTGTFWTLGGTPVGLQIAEANDSVIFFSTASSGSFNFTASDPPYVFGPTVSGSGLTAVSGNCTSPILLL
jgi:hypothetical protein